MLQSLQSELRHLGTPQRAKNLAWFFKTGPGQYGEGDVFIGITVPEIRQMVKKYFNLSLPDVKSLLHSKEHEFRLTALLILVKQFEKADEKKRQQIFDLYLKNTKWINNWDLVDLSAPNIVGTYLLDKSRSKLLDLARSTSLWERRIAILSAFAFIKKGESATALRIAKMLLKDEHDLIHKAVGWMLREVGKRCRPAEELKFLDVHYRQMPRTMLRYAIERLTPEQKVFYMKK